MSAHQYRIRPINPAAHLYEVSVTITNPDPAGQVLTMPAWIPGSYMIRDYARNVVAVRAESDGRHVRLDKLDKTTWRAAATDRALTVTAEIFAYDNSVRGAHLDNTHAYFNGPCVFFSIAGQEQTTCELTIEPPPEPVGKDWRVATSMRRTTAEPYGFGGYSAADYDELIDHPVEIGDLTIGEFEVDGIPHAIAIRGHSRADMGRICHDIQTICEEQMRLLGAPNDLDRYLFLLHAPVNGYGGLEHRWSSSLVCSRDYLPLRADAEMSDDYRTFLGLVSHEYFHLWNVKRLKPARFTPFDLSQEVHTDLLWVFEGITSYYDDLALVRSGIIDRASYFELLGRTMTRVQSGAGRSRQSVAESSFDAWTKFYKQDANAANAIVSYYAKGSLVALALDLKLRAESDVSLDDVMRECWRRWGETGEGMPEDGVEDVTKSLSGLDLDDFFDAAVRGTGELPLKRLLATHGVELQQRPATGKSDKGGTPAAVKTAPPPWLGANLLLSDGKSVFTVIHNDSPAEKAGVAPGDIAVALGGIALTHDNVDRRLLTYQPGDRLELVVFRGDELLTLNLRLSQPPNDRCFLQVQTDSDEECVARLDSWLPPAGE